MTNLPALVTQCGTIFGRRHRVLEDTGYFFPQWRRWWKPAWQYYRGGSGVHGYVCFNNLVAARRYIRYFDVPPRPGLKIHAA